MRGADTILSDHMTRFWTILGCKIRNFIDLLVLFKFHGQIPLPITKTLDMIKDWSPNQNVQQAAYPTIGAIRSLERATPASITKECLTLQLLPSEILLEIVQYLGPSSLKSLHRVCRRTNDIYIRHLKTHQDLESIFDFSDLSLYSVFEVMIRRSFGSSHNALRHLERMAFLAMLERDDSIPPSRSICSACATTHETRCFSDETLRQMSKFRECLGTSGRMWICPNTILSFEQVRTLGGHLRRHVIIQDCDSLSVAGRMAMTVKWPLLHTPPGYVPLSSCVSALLSLLHAPVCPHWQLKDSFVISQYDEECKLLKPTETIDDLDMPSPCECNGCTGRTGECVHCGTKVQFVFGYDIHFKSTLFVTSSRKLGIYKNCTDPTWIAQLNHSSDFTNLERAWKQTMHSGEHHFKQGGPSISVKVGNPWQSFAQHVCY